MPFFKIILVFLISTTKYFCLNSQYEIKIDENNELIWIKNFENFSIINLGNELINTKIIQPSIFFIPKNKMNLTNDFLLMADGKSFNLSLSFLLVFSKIKSFGSKESIFKKISQGHNLIDLQFYHSIFFYSVECNDKQVDGIFKHVQRIDFAFSVRYLPNVCPLVFKNSNLESIQFYGLSKNFLSTNHLDFDQKIDLRLINSTIYSLYLNLYKGIITRKMMIFKNTSVLRINGIIDKIERYSFLEMKLKLIGFFIDNEVVFISKGIDWTFDLNSGLRMNFTDLNNLKKYRDKVIFISFYSKKYAPLKETYLFPDQDFCLFKNFPDERLVFFELKLKKNFTCLEVWLSKKMCLFYNLLNIYNEIWLCNNISFLKELISECNFDKRIQNCNKTVLNVNKISKNLILYYSEIMDYYLVIISYSLVLIAFFSNLISFFILIKLLINYLYVKDAKNSIELLMLANCSINLIYLMTHFIHLAKKCVYQHSNFCPDFHITIESQLIEIIVVDIFGNLLKFTSNLLQIMVSAKKLMLLDPQFKNKLILFLNSRIFQITFIFFVLFYVIILIGTQIITTQINKMPFQLNHLENYLEYPNKKIFFVNYLLPIIPVSTKTNSSVTVLIFFIFNISINNILSISLFCFAEILFFFNAKSNINKKKKLNLGVKLKKSPNNKSLNVVLVNLMCLIFFRIISILISIFIIYQKSTNYYFPFNICSTHHKVCTIFQEIDGIIFLITISFIVVFYFYAYKKFKESILKTTMWILNCLTFR